MFKKGQKGFDEFAWIILGAVGFVLAITIIFSASIAKPMVEPKNVEVTLLQESSHTFVLTISAEDGRSMSNVTLTPIGEFQGWVTFSKNHFDVKNITTVNVKIDVPNSATLKQYTGFIRVETQGGSSSTSVKINVTNDTSIKLQSRPIFIGEYDIKNLKGVKTVFSKDNVFVSSGLFTDNREILRAQLTEQDLNITTEGYIELYINQSNQNGNLIVELNGVELYNKNTVVGKVIVPFERSLVNTTNNLIIRSTGPFPLFFWQTSEYKITQTNFVVKYIDIKESKGTFELTNTELANFHHLALQGRITEYSAPLEDLLVRINNQLVFAERPPLAFFNQTLEKDILGNRILVGHNNTISFTFEKDAFLILKDAFIVVYFT